MDKWVFIDVDGTLIDHNDAPRPYVRELFERLSELDVTVVVWSAGGAFYAQDKFRMLARRVGHDLSQYVKAYWWKAWHDTMVIKAEKFYIDDQPAMLEARRKEGATTFEVPFYDATIDHKQKDDWLLKAAKEVEKWAE